MIQKIALFLLLASPLMAQLAPTGTPYTQLCDGGCMLGDLIAHSAPPPPLRALLGQTTPAPSVSLSWTASVTTGGTVTIYRCVGTPCTATSAFTLLTSGVAAAGPYSDTSVTAGVYSYFLEAVVNGASSPPSNTVIVTIAPAPPTGLTGTGVN